MSPDDLRHLRRRFRLTQVQFANRLGVSPALVASLECGRRRIIERHVREIDRIFGDDMYGRQPVLVQNTVAPVVKRPARRDGLAELVKSRRRPQLNVTRDR